jgi:RNA polymerase sigma-70 factor (ECF subfamily)
MTDPQFQTTQLRAWLDRLHAGDLTARDELLRAASDRLERLTRKMLGQFPRVQRWAETGDVLQGALLRLLRSLEVVPLSSTREFFRLAAEQIRRELLDLARHYYGPRGLGANHASQAGTETGPTPEPIDTTDEPSELEKWCLFHEAVERLPAEEREVVGLIYYHGWSTAEVAELFGVSERTVRRRWQGVLVKLHGLMKDAESAG